MSVAGWGFQRGSSWVSVVGIKSFVLIFVLSLLGGNSMRMLVGFAGENKEFYLYFFFFFSFNFVSIY